MLLYRWPVVKCGPSLGAVADSYPTASYWKQSLLLIMNYCSKSIYGVEVWHAP